MLQFRSRTLRTTIPLLLSTGICLSSLPLSASAQIYIPPDLGKPGRRQGGGTRGGCLTAGTSLTALMPVQNFGYTLTAHPTLFWYVPQVSAEAAELILLDEDDNEIYKSVFQVRNAPGIISLSLPTNANFPPLQIGQNYRWEFSLICDLQDRSGDLYVEGWIQRTEPSRELANKLETASPDELPTLYAEAGIWYDALASLAQLRRARPSTFASKIGWTRLLNSVGLGEIVNENFIQCCTQPVSEQANSGRH
ncbi:MAG: DUF928 domain-containing protein [Cyanothece sp. SIO1E1]|nr:DUF928 domain-containing protein [Cyanothece sp. SIO1E1]